MRWKEKIPKISLRFIIVRLRLTDTDRYTQIQSIEYIAPWNTLQRILGNRQDIDSIAATILAVAQNYHTGDNGN